MNYFFATVMTSSRAIKVLMGLSLMFLLFGCPGPSYDMRIIDTRADSLTIELWEWDRSGQAKKIGPAQVYFIVVERGLATQDSREVLWEIAAIGPRSELGPKNSVLLDRLTYGKVPPGFEQIQAPVRLKPNENIIVTVSLAAGGGKTQSIKLSN